jgi:hypothetical protein
LDHINSSVWISCCSHSMSTLRSPISMTWHKRFSLPKLWTQVVLVLVYLMTKRFFDNQQRQLLSIVCSSI